MRMPAHAPTVVGLTVGNPDAQSVWVPSAFTYVSAAPTIAGVAPNRGAIEGGTAVVITGTGFAAGATVLFDGQAAAITALSSESISVVSPAHASGTVSVLVRNVDGQSVTAVNRFTYDKAAPLITNVTPAIGPIEGGTTLTITGVRFGAGPAVTVGGLVARVLSNTPTAVTAETPAHAAGVVDVVLTFGNGQTATSLASFTYEDRRASETFVRYFAEGAAGSFFQTRFALANPHAEAVSVTVTFTDTQGTPTTMEVEVPARSRATIDETNRPALASEAFATTFEAPKVIGVERTMTWAAGGPAYGAHSDVGVTAPRTSWVLAEGATIAGFNTFYLLQNPTTTAAEVKVQYLLATGQRIEKIHPVAPLSRTNIWVNKDDPALAAAEMSATFTSLNNVPVVVERSMYRNNGSELFSAGHNSAAVDAPALRWFLAEGATGGTFDEFVLIANPNVQCRNASGELPARGPGADRQDLPRGGPEPADDLGRPGSAGVGGRGGVGHRGEPDRDAGGGGALDVVARHAGRGVDRGPQQSRRDDDGCAVVGGRRRVRWRQRREHLRAGRQHGRGRRAGEVHAADRDGRHADGAGPR